MMWSQERAIALCKAIEAICPQHGVHVALTGGCLYKDHMEMRKDCDILFYRIRQTPLIDFDGLYASLESLGITIEKKCGWVTKASIDGRLIDIFFPEQEGRNWDSIHQPDNRY